MNQPHPFRSIRFKMAAVFSGVFLLIELLAGSYLYERLRTVLIRTDNQMLTQRASTLAEKVQVAPVVVPLPNPEEWLKIDYRNGRFSQNLYTSPGFPRHLSTDTTGVREIAGWRMLVFSKPLSEDSTEHLYISVAHADQELRDNLRTLGYVLAFSMLGSLAVASVLSYRLAGVVLQPIRQVIAQARTINQAGRFDPLQVPPTGDEVEELGRTLNAMFERIAQNQRLQNNFFASASHELRTPLTIMQTEIEINLQNRAISGEMREFLVSQRDEIKRLQRLLEDFLLVSELKNNELRTHLQRQALDDLLLHAVDRSGTLLRQAGLTLSVEMDPTVEEYQIEGDSDKLTNVFLNLLENAAKHAVKQTTVHVSLGPGSPDGTFEVTIRNRLYAPIPDLDKLTAPFYQADVLQKGYGLGLWISQQVLQQQGVRMQISQEANWFSVRLCFRGIAA